MEDPMKTLARATPKGSNRTAQGATLGITDFLQDGTLKGFNSAGFRSPDDAILVLQEQKGGIDAGTETS